jgi:hypothetical protein
MILVLSRKCIAAYRVPDILPEITALWSYLRGDTAIPIEAVFPLAFRLGSMTPTLAITCIRRHDLSI